MKIFKTLMAVASAILCLGTAASAKTGDSAGYALNTDISCYINHYAIQSYAAHGKSYVIAEDLANYGFDVVWNPETFSLYIDRNPAVTEIEPLHIQKTGVPFSKHEQLLVPGVKVYAGGELIKSYAMDGQSVVAIEDLSVFGDVAWVPGEKSLKLWIDGMKSLTEKQEIQEASVQMYKLDLSEITVTASQIEEYRLRGWYTYIEFICAWADSLATDRGNYAAADYLYNKIISEEFDYGFEADQPIFNALGKYGAKLREEYNTPLFIIDYSADTSSGTPVATIEMWNISGKPITEVQVSFTCYDSSGNETTDSEKNTAVIKGRLKNISFSPMDKTKYRWTLKNNTKTTSIGKVEPIKIVYDDGTVWKKPEQS